MTRPHPSASPRPGTSAHEERARRDMVLAAAVLLAGLAGAVLFHLSLDPYAASLARACSGPCHAVARSVTRFGEGWETLLPAGAILIAAMVALWRRWPLEARFSRLVWVMAYVLVAVGGSGLLAAALKHAIGRARPALDPAGLWLQHPFAWQTQWASFPSGHATTAGATAVVLALLFPRRARAIVTVALLVAASRVVVGAHFPSDVAAGFALGAAFALVTAAGFLLRGRVFQLCGGRVFRLPVLTPPCAAAGVPGRGMATAGTRQTA